MAATFRPEIAGLRAIAVVSVVLFHLKVSGFEGGFVGVDEFFVISGFLISRGILRELDKGRFSLAQFYIRRTRRIYPALIVTVIATYVVGAFWCAPLMFLDLAKECTHALLSIANIQYWRESHQYFAPNSEELAMLHCWSLSVEEQFYLVWPLFLVWCYRAKRVREAVLLTTLASFAAAVIFARIDASAVFFLMPFRIFEFGCGAIFLFLEERPRTKSVREGLSASGLAATIGSALLMRADLPYLEILSLVPCLGAGAIILGGRETVAARLTTHPVALAIGAVSYSLYLCHWPIIFFGRFIFGPAAETPLGILLLLATMAVVAALLFRYVERRFIQPPEAPPVTFWKYSLAFWSMVIPLVAITHATFVLKGFPWRLPPEQARLAHLQEFPSGVDLDQVSGPFAMQLVGDSHAVQYFAGLSPVMKQMGIKLEPVAFSGCPILHGVRLKRTYGRDYERCMGDQRSALDKLDTANLPVIFVQKWDFYDDATIDSDLDDHNDVHSQKGSYIKLEQAIRQTIGRVADQGRRILIIGRQVDAGCSVNLPRILNGPLPHVAPLPCPARNREAVEHAGSDVNQMLARIQARWPDQIELLRPVDYFCDTACPTVDNGIWLYRDSNHFTVAGSHYMVERAEQPIRRFLADTRTRPGGSDMRSREEAMESSAIDTP
jgi:peptidoglycan/LPS O-acetylase OafA/YrhL